MRAWTEPHPPPMPSTVIRFFYYSAERSELTIVFRTGRRYIYKDVPQSIFDAMTASFSKGEFFNAHIRDHFTFDRAS